MTNIKNFVIDRSDLTDKTYSVLRESILKREFKPGSRISVDEVATLLEVSRTPVMDALKRLANDGLVEIVPRSGTYVTQLNVRDVEEYFDIRIMIEQYAVGVIFDKGLIQQFNDETGKLIEAMESASHDDEYTDYSTFIDNDRQLHKYLVTLSGNSRLIQIYNDMNLHIQITRAHYLQNIENAREALQDHRDILEAFSSGDKQVAQKIIASHITVVKERIINILKERGGAL